MITNDAICTREIKSRMAVGKAAFNKEKPFFAYKLKFKEETSKVLLWSTALYGAETWALRKVDQRSLESFEMWCWRRMESIIGTDCVRNEYYIGSRRRRISYKQKKKKERRLTGFA
jgi:hypothetical protein